MMPSTIAPRIHTAGAMRFLGAGAPVVVVAVAVILGLLPFRDAFRVFDALVVDSGGRVAEGELPLAFGKGIDALRPALAGPAQFDRAAAGPVRGRVQRAVA